MKKSNGERRIIDDPECREESAVETLLAALTTLAILGCLAGIVWLSNEIYKKQWGKAVPVERRER